MIHLSHGRKTDSMSRKYVGQLADGDLIEEVYLVSDKQLRSNKHGNSFLQVELQDRTGKITGRVWNAGEGLFRSFEIGDFLNIKAKAQLFQGSMQLILSNVDKAPNKPSDLSDFLPRTEQDPAKLLERLKTYLRKLVNPNLRALAECFLIDDEVMNGFVQVPAGVKVHHAYVGGLLEHVVTMMDVADKLAPMYPGIDRDLLIMGIFLHDSGKIRELAFDRAFEYTDEGQLIGHLAIGMEMLSEKIVKVPELTEEPFPRELELRLKHLILSHHGSLEFGSAKVPMTPEAVALHAIDLLDSRIHICLRELKEDRNPQSNWTAYNPAMGRRVFKGLRNSSESGGILTDEE
jgi:3'-5' exoribonuclease